MFVEQAIHEHWSSYAPLTRLVPSTRVFTGTAPSKDENDEAIQPPYVSLLTKGDVKITRTSSGTLLANAKLRINVLAPTYAEAKEIVQEVIDHFNRADFEWSKGKVLDMKPVNRVEVEEKDGTWRIMVDFATRTSQVGD